MEGLARQFVFHAGKRRIELIVSKLESHLEFLLALKLVSRTIGDKAPRKVSVGVPDRDAEVDRIGCRNLSAYAETRGGPKYDRRLVITHDPE